MNTILVTGGAGFIGSHTCVALLEAGFNVIIADNFSNSSIASIQGIEAITGKTLTLYEIDIANPERLRAIFSDHKINAVIHFAGLKAVGESCQQPLLYYAKNLQSTLTLLQEMSKAGVFNLIFSSSATVYASSNSIPYKEHYRLGGNSPYAETKIMIEKMLSDIFQSDPIWKITLLRYFNPAGAHPSALIGENPLDTPNNLMPFITQVAAGKRELVQVFGNDYATLDGTGVRDYIHVMDVAEGHLHALNEVLTHNKSFIETYNLGSGRGYSVLEIIKMFENITHKPIKYKFAERRRGDISEFYADVSKIEKRLGWRPKYGLDNICQDAWNWQIHNLRNTKK